MRPPDAKTIPDLLDELAARYPDHEALVGGETRLDYRALRAEVRRLAKGLYALGVRRGDKVGLLMGNRPEWILAAFATTLLGATMVAVNTWATARELAHVLVHSDTRFLVTVDRFLKHDYLAMLDALGREGDALAGVQEVVRVGGPAGTPGTALRGAVGAGGGGRRRGDRARASRRARRGCRLSALHLGHHGAAQGRPAPATTP